MGIVKAVVWIAVLLFPFFVAGLGLYISIANAYHPPDFPKLDPFLSLTFDMLFSPVVVVAILWNYPYTAIPFVVYYVLVVKCSSRINRLIVSIERRL